jgi:anaerobic glycerol-3-phosphate dehydrogenase
MDKLKKDRVLRMSESLVLIAGGGIGGLATALTLHQIGVPCVYSIVKSGTKSIH